MAPITRSSAYGRNPPATEVDQDESMSDASQEDFTQEDGHSPFLTSTHEMLLPLQITADRVTRQVEQFAESLDKFVADRESTDNSLWEDALVLLDRFSQHAKDRRDRSSHEASEEETDKLQLECDLYTLLRRILHCQSPSNLQDIEVAAASELGKLHRYSSNTELWAAFLDSDLVAQQYEAILSWLQDRAASGPTSIDDLTEEGRQKSHRSEGVWSAGPIYTQASIKQQKRTRIWSMPLEPSNPGLDRNHVRKDDRKRLVAQLDPDAPSRESALLATDDEWHDHAAWQAYWEMLRRGHSNAQIHSWFEERKELWRYRTLSGCGPTPQDMADSPWVRILNIATNPEWLHRCRVLAQHPDVQNQYLKAIYGVLCGDIAASRSTSTTIDDNLFCIVNSLLIERYQQYIRAYKSKLTQPSSTHFHSQPSSIEQIRQYATSLYSNSSRKPEARSPHRLLELAVASQDFSTFFITMGRAAAQVAFATGQGMHLMKNNTYEEIEVASTNAQDHDSVRVIAHLQLLLQSLGMLDAAYTKHEYDMENNIAAYIAMLESLGRWQLIPSYASRLSAVRSHHVMGAILINVMDQNEKDLQLRLMKECGIDVAEVIYAIFSLHNFAALQKMRSYSPQPLTAKVVMLVSEGKRAQHKICPGLMAGELDEADSRSVRSVEWVRYATAENWGISAWSVAALYKIFFLAGNFVGLQQLIDRAGLREMSLAAVGMNLLFADEDPPLSPDQGENGDDGDEDMVQPMSSPSRKRKVSGNNSPSDRSASARHALASKSLIWKQLEQLAIAIDMLDQYQDVADGVEKHKNEPSLSRNFRRNLKPALEAVRTAMSPIFDNDFLCLPDDENEALILNDIRNHYIPEVILAYNSALWSAGHFSSRTWLVECMNLAQIVAETPMLTAAFVTSGRMKELVRAFAVDSQALLQAGEANASSSRKSLGQGKQIKAEKGNADVWKVTWKEDYRPMDLEAVD